MDLPFEVSSNETKEGKIKSSVSKSGLVIPYKFQMSLHLKNGQGLALILALILTSVAIAVVLLLSPATIAGQ
ncbi:MAG: hypothetical protein WC270_06505 [Patescibacteria group bacterium]|jgi:hypothetical protein